MKRYFITTILPESLIAKHQLSFAACNFSKNLISGNGFDEVYSILPLFVNGQINNINETSFKLIYNHKLRTYGRLGRLFACLIEQWNIFRHIDNGSSVWLYNLTTLNAFLFIMLSLFKRTVKINVIVLDFTPEQKKCSLNNLYLRLINRANGRIALSYSDLFNKKNLDILPGVVPLTVSRLPELENIKPKFLLSGALNEVISQTNMVLKAFSQLPHCELYITGTITDDTLIKEYAERYTNIHYLRQVPFSEYLELLHTISYQLSTRDIKFPENQCNFPSKIIEALLHNRIIISTINYPQLDGIKYFDLSSKTTSFKESINKIVQLSQSELLGYANQADIVFQKFNVTVWNEMMARIEKKS